VLGLLCVFIGSVFSAIGLNLIRASGLRENHRPFYRRPRYLGGLFLVTVVNTSLDSVAFAFVPVSVIAPFGGVAMVVSALIARSGKMGFREYLDWFQWVALGVVVVSVGLIGGLGPKPPPQIDSAVLFAEFDAPPFVAYQVVWGVAVAVSYSVVYSEVVARTSIKTTIVTGLAGGISSGITQTMLKLIASLSAGAAIIDGAASAWANFPWRNAHLWRAFALLIVAAVVLLHNMTMCIASANVGVSTAVFQSILIVSSVFAGSAFYGDLVGIPAWRLAVFVAALVMTVVGVAVLVYRKKEEPQDAMCEEEGAPTVSIQLSTASIPMEMKTPSLVQYDSPPSSPSDQIPPQCQTCPLL